MLKKTAVMPLQPLAPGLSLGLVRSRNSGKSYALTVPRLTTVSPCSMKVPA